MSRVRNGNGRVNGNGLARHAAGLGPDDAVALTLVGRKMRGSRVEVSAGEYEVDFTVRVHGTMTVKPDVEASKSPVPELVPMIGWLLYKLPAKQRDRLLKDIPNEFRLNRQRFPTIPHSIVVQTTEMLKRLRREVKIQKHGAVVGTIKIERVDDAEPFMAVRRNRLR